MEVSRDIQLERQFYLLLYIYAKVVISCNSLLFPDPVRTKLEHQEIVVR